MIDFGYYMLFIRFFKRIFGDWIVTRYNNSFLNVPYERKAHMAKARVAQILEGEYGETFTLLLEQKDEA